MNVGSQVGSLISEGPWIFIGLPNLVKVGVDYYLSGFQSNETTILKKKSRDVAGLEYGEE